MIFKQIFSAIKPRLREGFKQVVFNRFRSRSDCDAKIFSHDTLMRRQLDWQNMLYEVDSDISLPVYFVTSTLPLLFLKILLLLLFAAIYYFFIALHVIIQLIARYRWHIVRQKCIEGAFHPLTKLCYHRKASIATMALRVPGHERRTQLLLWWWWWCVCCFLCLHDIANIIYYYYY